MNHLALGFALVIGFCPTSTDSIADFLTRAVATFTPKAGITRAQVKTAGEWLEVGSGRLAPDKTAAIGCRTLKGTTACRVTIDGAPHPATPSQVQQLLGKLPAL